MSEEKEDDDLGRCSTRTYLNWKEDGSIKYVFPAYISRERSETKSNILPRTDTSEALLYIVTPAVRIHIAPLNSFKVS